ncbi:hypothetical protein PVAG01_10708 [Phlyctema vagabunda]|uniref:GEgh 16 protein n=1 Tax=Phlyctema vagabunda TaxID=108571 RepID=A0ABR4P321_9HELO
MPSLYRLLLVAPALLAVAHSQGVIQSAQGDKGSPASLPLQVDTTAADANIINTQEITDNVVNECGRTLLGGNIDIGENTEGQLIAKTVTSVTKGSTVQVTIDQINDDGAGPYTCDLDQTSNANGATGQTPLDVTEKDSKAGVTTLTLTMPADMACIGASTGDVCTVRCFNAAKAGPFGGCFAVQQTDVTPTENSANQIATAQTLKGVLAQVEQNKEDFPAAVAANQESSLEDQGVNAVDALLDIDSTASATASADAVANTGAANAGNGNGRGRKGNNNGNTAAAGGNTATNGNAATNRNGNGNGRGNNNAATGNAATGNAANAATGNGNGNRFGNGNGGFGNGFGTGRKQGRSFNA